LTAFHIHHSSSLYDARCFTQVAGVFYYLGMPYLVDGNNVMGQRVGWHRDKAGARRRLLVELAQYAREARVSVQVVFDGAPEEHFPDGSSFMGVRVLYAARGADADARIKELVDTSRERRTLIVVTSDRALADYVRRSGAQVVRAGEFRRRLDELRAETASSAGEEVRAPASAAELDEWMYYFGVAPEDEDATGAGDVRQGDRRTKKPTRGKKR
jgi:predicted RNA-binding protein with PIN domain